MHPVISGGGDTEAVEVEVGIRSSSSFATTYESGVTLGAGDKEGNTMIMLALGEVDEVTEEVVDIDGVDVLVGDLVGVLESVDVDVGVIVGVGVGVDVGV